MFFATGSKHAEFLESYVQGQLLFLRTTSGMGGLPKVLRRGVVESQYSKPNLLFLDLSDPPPSAGVPVPERFGVSGAKNLSVVININVLFSRHGFLWLLTASA